MMKKRFFMAALAALCICTMAGCREKAETPAGKAETEETGTPARQTETEQATGQGQAGAVQLGAGGDIPVSTEKETQSLPAETQATPAETTDADAGYMEDPGYSYLLPETISDDDTTVTVYGIKEARSATNTGSFISCMKSGVEVQSALYWDEDADTKEGLERLLAEEIEMEKGMLEELDFYTDISTGEVFSGDTYALQQIDYTYTDGGGNTFPCLYIAKVDTVGEDLYALSCIRVDNSEADGDTRPLAREVFQAYGIDFEFR